MQRYKHPRRLSRTQFRTCCRRLSRTWARTPDEQSQTRLAQNLPELFGTMALTCPGDVGTLQHVKIDALEN